MAATYVQITREEMHDWLDGAVQKIHGERWEKVENREGVYVIPLSKTVGVHISTSIGQTDKAMAVGEAAIHSKLISRITGRTLNKKAAEQSRVNRTKGWALNLLKVVEKFAGAYQKSPKFYDIIAQEGGMDAYIAKWKPLVEALQNWKANKRLRDIYGQLEAGRVLSDQDEQFVLRFEDERIPNEVVGPGADWMARIEAIPGWQGSDFLQSMMEKLESGRRLTGPMEDAIEKIEREGLKQVDKALEARILAIPGVESNKFLQDLLEKVRKGWKLSPAQMAAIEKTERGKVSPQFDKEMEARILAIPGAESQPFLRDILEKVRKGYSLNDNQVRAIDRTGTFLRDLRERWLMRLRNILKENPAQRDLLVRIGVALRESNDAHPSLQDMTTLGTLFRVQDLIKDSTPRPSQPQRTAERVAALYMGRS